MDDFGELFAERSRDCISAEEPMKEIERVSNMLAAAGESEIVLLGRIIPLMVFSISAYDLTRFSWYWNWAAG